MTFFSGTDLNTLKGEGASMPHFVSLIVNNKGDYTAAITSRARRVFRGTVSEVVDTFNNGVVSQNSEAKEFSDSCIRYNFFDITVERDSWITDISSRVNTILESKKRAVPSPIMYGNSFRESPFDSLIYDGCDKQDKNRKISTPKSVKQLEIFEDDEPFSITNTEECSKVVKKTLFLDPYKDVSETTIKEALHYFRDTLKNNGEKYVEKSLKHALSKSVERVTGKDINSTESLNLLNDIATYIDELTQTDYIADAMFAREFIEILTTIFNETLSLIEQ